MITKTRELLSNLLTSKWYEKVQLENKIEELKEDMKFINEALIEISTYNKDIDIVLPTDNKIQVITLIQ